MKRNELVLGHAAEIKVPYTLKKFGYHPDKSPQLRKAAIVRASTVAGNEPVLFDMSSMVMLARNRQDVFPKLKEDLNYFITKIRR